MTQEELQEIFINFAELNLNNETALKAIKELLENISNELYYNGYTKESNSLSTCSLTIGEILESERL